MNKQTITFTASEQTLTKTGGIEHYASNIVSYIEASFTLGDNWAGYDSIRAVWESGYARIATVLDANNKCIVPAEVLTYKSKVNVNLVGSIVENTVLTDRLTTYPILALTVDADARVDSSETTPVTASQFEQFVDVVRDEASAIQNYTYDSEAWAVGQRAGVDVPSTDETYHNNAKYYADQGATLQQEVTDLKSDLSEYNLENKFDGSVSQGYWDTDNHIFQIVSYGDYIASTNAYACSAGQKVRLIYISSTSVVAYNRLTLIFWDSSNNYITHISINGAYVNEQIAPENTAKVTFHFRSSNITPSNCGKFYLYINDEFSVVIKEIKAIDEKIGYTSPTFTTTSGKYINKYGVIDTSASFMYSSPIKVSKGDFVQFYGCGSSTNVAMIATCDENGSNIVARVISIDSNFHTYEYDVPENGYIIVSSWVGSMKYELTIIKNYENQNLLKAIQDIENQIGSTPYCDLSLFQKIGVVGDSYASGELYYGGQYVDKYPISWGQIMARKHGISCTNYSSGGLTTRSWLNATKGLPLLLANPAEDLYLLALGINDYYSLGQNYLGSITDITSHQSYEDYGDTFYGNYGRIIEQIQAHAPNSKIVIFTVANTETVPQMFSDAVIEIAGHYNIPYIVQASDSFFQSAVYTTMSGGHPTAIGYSGMAVAFERLLDKCIRSNISYFFDAFMY